MRRHAFRASVLVAWLLSMAWLVRYEVLADYFAHAIRGYRSLVSDNVLLSDSWMRILYDGVPIGYSFANFETDDTNPVRHFLISNRIFVRLNLMGETRSVVVQTDATLDALYHLQDFSFHLTSPGYRLIVEARRTHRERFSVQINANGQHTRTSIRIPDDVLIYSPMTEMMMRDLDVGQQVRFTTFDPASLATVPVVMTALRREPLPLGTNRIETTVLRAEMAGMQVLTWIDNRGATVKQQTPLWAMERCTPEQALATLREETPTPDMLRRMAIPCDGTLRDPRRCTFVRLRLSGAVPTPKMLAVSDRQTLESVSGTGTVLVVRHGAQPGPAVLPPLSPDDRAASLRASPFLQSDAPEIRKAALDIADGAPPLAAAERICAWVNTNVRKEMRITLPSALDVWKSRAGDCNEHTYLAVALGRAAGVPARIHVGVALHEGRFYYHAWPAFYVDRWVEMDPTWGQKRVDATHIALVEGELSNQVQVVRLLGQLRATVLDEGPPITEENTYDTH